MAINYSELAVQQIFSIDCFNLEDGSLLARLKRLKTSSWANNGTVVYAQGGVGNPRIIGFTHSKASNIQATSAVITDGTWGMQTGSGVETLTNTTKIQYEETLVCSTADEVTTEFVATGTAGEEIVWAYKVGQYGNTITKFEQADAVAEGKFTYSSATRKLAFNTGDVSVGDRILVFYYPTVSTAHHVKNSTDKSSMNVKAVANTMFKDACTGKDYRGQIVFHKAKVSEETTFDISADGDPAVQNLNLEAMVSCESNDLWDLYLFDEDDITAAQ